MRRADRLFQIVQILRAGRLVTAAQLADRLEVSLRTVYRDMADLQASGVPIEGEAGVGYVMRSGYDLPPLMFSRDEITALVAGARLIKAWGGAAMASAADDALSKIEAVLPDEIRARVLDTQIHAIAIEMTPHVRARIDQLDRWVEQRHRIRLSYHDEKGVQTDRIIRPLGLWFWGKVWTLVAWCELRADFRLFRLDRMDNATETGDRFIPAPGQGLEDFYEALRQEGCGEP